VNEMQLKVLIDDAVDMMSILHRAGYRDIGTDADYSRPDTHTTIIIRELPIMDQIEHEIMG